MVKNLSLKNKLIAGQIMLTAIIACVLYGFYIAKIEEDEMKSIHARIRYVNKIFSIGIGEGIGERDFDCLTTAMDLLKEDAGLVQISALNHDGNSIISYSTQRARLSKTSLLPTDSFTSIGETIFHKTYIVHKNRNFGTLVIGYSLKAFNQSMQEAHQATLYFCLVFFIAGVCLAYIISNGILARVKRLNRSVIQKSNDTQLAAASSSRDEFAILEGTLQEIVHARTTSTYDELMKQAQHLKERNDDLSQFSYVVSHDLKAPLHAILKLSEWIEEDLAKVMHPESKKNMEILRGRVLRLEALVDGILQYSEIGRANVAAEHVDVKRLLNETIDLLSPPRHVKITVDNIMPVIFTKKFQLQQVFLNLISNAIKYNDKPQGIVTISVTTIGNYYRFSVEDNGIGIASAYHEKVFEVFQTLQSRDKRGGTGVGLSITKRNIEDMGGVIILESEENKGTKFIFTWPKAA